MFQQTLNCTTLLLAAMFTALGFAGESDTAFTYQGFLTQNGEPVTGMPEVDYALWDAPVGGNQVGAKIVISSQEVVDGVFTAELDFGVEAFTNESRWLEVRVEGDPLLPRQRITRSPYALQTRGLFVDADNRVGIGTTTPSMFLDVHNDFGGPGSTPPKMGVSGEFTGTLRWLTMSLQPAIQWNDTNDLRFGSESAIGAGFQEHMRITPDGGLILTDGRIGVGTDDPIALIEIEGTAIGGAALRLNTGSPTGIISESTAELGKGIEGECDAPSGVGVFGRAGHTDSVNYAVRGTCSSTRGFDFFAGGNGTNYGSTSSRRWKRNIRPIDDALEQTRRLRGVYFDWDADHGGHHDIGMIAEEVGEVLPEVVNYEDNGVDAIGMDYSKLTPLLVEAVNALRAEKDAEIEALRAEKDSEIRALHDRLERLEQMLNRSTSDG